MEHSALFLEYLKRLGKRFECFKSSFDTVEISCFILEAELWGVVIRSCCAYELNHISSIYGKCANQICMTLAMVHCSIKMDQGGMVPARVRISLVSWDWGSHVVLIVTFMVPLG